ncbi:MAG: ArnT family glycosyltransferase [Armatimonadota bacterium]
MVSSSAENLQVAAPTAGSSRNTFWGLFFIIVVAVVMYLGALGAYPFLDPDEGRYAEIPREMLHPFETTTTLDAFVTPRLNGIHYFEKPPLFYWLVAGAQTVFGSHEWASRLVPALCGLAMLLLVIVLGWRMGGPRLGLLGGWVQATTILPLAMSRILTIDILVSTCLAWTWGAWWFGYSEENPARKRRWYLLAWVFLALAVMSKGLVALALTGGIIFLFLLLRGELRKLGEMAWLPGLAIFAIIVLPWHIFAARLNGDWAHFYLWEQQFARFLGLGDNREHVKPFSFFFWIFPLGMGAWAAAFIPALIVNCKTWWKPKAQSIDPEKDTKSAVALFLFLWLAVIILFFSASTCKLVPYVLPAYPAGALLVGSLFTGWQTRNRRVRVTTFGIAALGIILAALTVLLIQKIPHYLLTKQQTIPAGEVFPWAWGLIAVLGISAVLLLISVWAWRMQPLALGLVLVLLIPVLFGVVVKVSTYKKIGILARALSFELTKSGYSLPADAKIVDWGYYDQSVSYYLKQRVTLVNTMSELPLAKSDAKYQEYFMRGDDALSSLLADGKPVLINVEYRRLREKETGRVRPAPGDLDLLRAIRDTQSLKPIASNTGNTMFANEAFLRATGLLPWSLADIERTPVLLLPKSARM